MSIDRVEIELPDFATHTLTRPSSQVNPAAWTEERLRKLIGDFEASLDSEHEVGLAAVGVPGGGCVHVTDIGYWGPDLVMFYGKSSDGSQLQIIQNVAQINLMLVAVPKLSDEAIRLFQEGSSDEA